MSGLFGGKSKDPEDLRSTVRDLTQAVEALEDRLIGHHSVLLLALTAILSGSETARDTVLNSLARFPRAADLHGKDTAPLSRISERLRVQREMLKAALDAAMPAPQAPSYRTLCATLEAHEQALLLLLTAAVAAKAHPWGQLHHLFRNAANVDGAAATDDTALQRRAETLEALITGAEQLARTIFRV